jgi:phosphotriesterase-related protein
MSPKGPTGKVQTVLGEVEPGSLGITLTHEHLLIDLRCYFEMPEEASERWYVDRPVTMETLGKIRSQFYTNKDNQMLLDERFAIEEVLKYRYAGGNSLVDTTSIGIGRDPLALARISRATGLKVIMGASHYVPESHPVDMDERSEESIAQRIIDDVTVGVGDTGVKSGVIGEVGNHTPLTENMRKVLRASAYAQVETGAPILIHPGIHPDTPLEIMRELTDAGAKAENVIMGHLDNIRPMSAIKELADTGCYLEYDRFGSEDTSGSYRSGDYETSNVSDVQRMESLEELISDGYGERITIAHDVCLKADTTAYGGKGYAHILESIVPRMRNRGFTQEQLDNILIHNPARALTFA